MLDILFNKGALPLLQEGISFTNERHRVLVNNIANIDTPHYKAQDAPVADFRELLKQAIEERDQRPVRVLKFEGDDKVRVHPTGTLEVDAEDSDLPGVLRHSENNVNPEREATKLVENAQMHNTLTVLLAGEFGLLDAAVRERPA